MTSVVASMIHTLTHANHEGLSDQITKRIDPTKLPRLTSTFVVVELDETRDNLFKIWVIGAAHGTEELIVLASVTMPMSSNSWVSKINELAGTFRCDSIWVTHLGVYAALRLSKMISRIHLVGEGDNGRP